MNRLLYFLALTLALVVGIANSAFAAGDTCLSLRGSSLLHVGKGFKIPPKGKCRDWRGFVTGGGNLSNGNACTASDGSRVTFTITTTIASDYIETDLAIIPLPAKTGDANYYCFFSQTSSSNSCTFHPASVVACPSKNMPVP